MRAHTTWSKHFHVYSMPALAHQRPNVGVQELQHPHELQGLPQGTYRQRLLWAWTCVSDIEPYHFAFWACKWNDWMQIFVKPLSSTHMYRPCLGLLSTHNANAVKQRNAGWLWMVHAVHRSCGAHPCIQHERHQNRKSLMFWHSWQLQAHCLSSDRISCFQGCWDCWALSLRIPGLVWGQGCQGSYSFPDLCRSDQECSWRSLTYNDICRARRIAKAWQHSTVHDRLSVQRFFTRGHSNSIGI